MCDLNSVSPSCVTGSLTSVTSVSDFKATLSASSQNPATFTGAVVLEVLSVHGAGHKCDISDSPSSVVAGRESVPTVSLVWASTHHYTRHSAFSNVYYWCGTSGFGEKLDWTSGVDYFSHEREKKWFTHSFNPSLQIQEQNKRKHSREEKRMLINNRDFCPMKDDEERISFLL